MKSKKVKHRLKIDANLSSNINAPKTSTPYRNNKSRGGQLSPNKKNGYQQGFSDINNFQTLGQAGGGNNNQFFPDNFYPDSPPNMFRQEDDTL